MMKKYFVYLDDGKDVYKIAIPAETEEKARQFVNGNGEVIAVKEITDCTIEAEKVADALISSQQFDDVQTDLIIRALSSIGIAE